MTTRSAVTAPRISDRLCFEAMLVRLVTGCSWVDAERLTGGRVSDTTLRARRDEWIAAGVFDRLVEEALAGYDRVIGLDLAEVAIDGSLHKAPCGGEGTGKSPVDRGKLGWKWSIATDSCRHPDRLGDRRRQPQRLCDVARHLGRARAPGLLGEIETLHLDRGYDNGNVRRQVAEAGITDLVCAKQRRTGTSPGTQRKRRLFPSGCAGRSSGPTPGSRTSASSGATPTADRAPTRSARDRGRSCSSPPSSSTGATGGVA